MKDDFYNNNTTPWEVGNVHFDLSVAVAVTTRTVLLLLYDLVVWVNAALSLSLSLTHTHSSSLKKMRASSVSNNKMSSWATLRRPYILPTCTRQPKFTLTFWHC